MVQQKQDLIVFGEDWGRHPSSTQHLMTYLSVGRRVLWVNSIGLRKPHWSRADLKRLLEKWSAHHNPAVNEAVPATITLYSPLAIPWPGSRGVALINRAWLTQQLRPKIVHYLRPRPLLWTSLPSAITVVGRLGEQGVVYYCGDDFSALAGVDHAAVTAMEGRLAQKADLILAANATLAQRFPPEKTHIISHGVDTALFSTPQPRPLDLPPGPVAGFYGSLASWLDIELLAALAQAMPNWQFVLIGTPQVELTSLQTLSNIHCLGPKPYAALPAYVQHWQVSLLPFRDTPQIQACNPLKLREYLAVGTPIVATPFPALADYREHVMIASGVDAFAAAIHRACQEDAMAKQRRRTCVATETWQAQAQKVERLLEQMRVAQ